PECASPNNHGIGNGSQESHHHLIVPIEPTDVPTTRMARFIQRHNPIQCRNKVANDIGPTRMRELQTPKKGQEVRWERQVTSTFHVEELLQRSQNIHACTPHTSKNSIRSAGLLSYSPRQNVVRVKGAISRTPRICV